MSGVFRYVLFFAWVVVAIIKNVSVHMLAHFVVFSHVLFSTLSTLASISVPMFHADVSGAIWWRHSTRSGLYLEINVDSWDLNFDDLI